jgi:hypothetical protein
MPIGLQVDLSAVTVVPVFFLLLIAVAFLGKLFAGAKGLYRHDPDIGVCFLSI